MNPVDPMTYRGALDRLDIAKKALRNIAKGEGAFSLNQYTHAIENMKALATEAILVIARLDSWDATIDNAQGVPVPPSAAEVSLELLPTFDLGRLDDKFMGFKVRLDDTMPKGTLRCYSASGELLGEINSIGEW